LIGPDKIVDNFFPKFIPDIKDLDWYSQLLSDIKDGMLVLCLRGLFKA